MKKAAVFLVDVNEIIEEFNKTALDVIENGSENDEVSEFVQGEVEGLSKAGEVLVQYLKKSLKFADFPK